LFDFDECSAFYAVLTGDSQHTATGGDGGVVQRGAERQPATTGVERAAVKSDVQSSLSNFTLVKVLGKGSFGKVLIHPSTHY